jgi:hypothetical protein
VTASSPDVDLDRLADFVGGALDGTPDAETVRTLVHTDPRWAEAYTALVTADAAVRSDLTALASATPPMPADIAARLERAFAAEFSTTAVGGRGKTSQGRIDPSRPGHRPPAGHPGPAGPTGPSRARRRPRRFAFALAAVASVVVLGVAGVTALQATRDGGLPGSSQMDSQAVAPEQPAAEGADQAPVIVTDNDYSTSTLGRSADDVPPLAPPDKNSLGDGLDSPPSAGKASRPIPAELARLGDQATRDGCLSAIRAEYGGRVIRVEFARFQGTPAMIAFLDGARLAGGRRFVVVVGADCGAGGSIADERYHAVL